jgi:hypothetical protein
VTVVGAFGTCVDLNDERVVLHTDCIHDHFVVCRLAPQVPTSPSSVAAALAAASEQQYICYISLLLVNIFC